MASVKDIISSIFRKFENEELSPEFIRDEANEVCDILGISRVGDPGRTAREFAERGFVSKYNGTCKYSPDAINLTLRNEFESYEYVYAYADYESKMQMHSQKKFEDLLVQLKKCIDDNPNRKSQIQKEILSTESFEGLSLVFPIVDENEFIANKSEDEVIQKLAECLIKEHNEKNTAGYAYFGFKYGHLINKLGKVVEKIVRQAKIIDPSIYDTAGTEIRHGLNTYNNVSKEGCVGKANVSEFEFNFAEDDSVDDNSLKDRILEKSFTPSQIIYYGVPGCGKSKKIMDLLDIAKQKGEITDEEKQVVRVVFHPEYTNADFVGQVMPVVKPAGGVDYDFAAGPFTRILARAYANPTKPYFLVIEEINRGNAAAIFGEIFQLLDRHKKGESDSVGGNLYTAGWSKYFVDHVDVNGKISAEIAGTEYGSDEEKPAVNFTANTAIRLPPNLSIYATMNTSDQNVFTLDNAFKRRFDSELVKNTLDGEQHKAQRETKIENTGVTWGTFWEKVNDLILEKNTSMISSEDKRLGAYFIIGEEKTDAAGDKYREISRKLFGEKVLEYLWDDAFKYKRKEIFAESCKSVESLIENFEEGGFTAIFKDEILGL